MIFKWPQKMSWFFFSYDGVRADLSDIGLASDEIVEESVVQIVDRFTRDVLFEWRSLQDVPYLDQFYDPNRAEYAHINSVEVDQTDGSILASLRGVSQIVKIDRSSASVLWTLGGKSNDFVFINDPYFGTCGQHEARRLNNGNLLAFDNGQYYDTEQRTKR